MNKDDKEKYIPRRGDIFTLNFIFFPSPRRPEGLILAVRAFPDRSGFEMPFYKITYYSTLYNKVIHDCGLYLNEISLFSRINQYEYEPI